MELQGVTLSNIDVDIDNDSPDNVNFTFNEGLNALEAGIINTNLTMDFEWKYSFLLSGKATVYGPVSLVLLDLGFTNATKNNFTVPQVDLSTFDFILDRQSFTLDFSCALCPQLVVNLLINIFRGSLLDSIENSVKNTLNEELINDINVGIYDFYPTTINATQDIGVCTALIDGVRIKSDHLELPVDLTVFLTSEGYQRQGDGPVVPAYDPEIPAEILVSLSSYVTTSIQNILNKTPLSFPFKVLLINMSLNILGPDYPTEISMKKDNLKIKGSPELDISGLKLKYNVELEANLDFSVRNGDDTNLLYITPQLKSVKLSKISVTFLGIKLNLTLFRILLNWIVQLVANNILIPTFEIPQLPGFPLKTTDSILQVNDDYIDFGLSIKFDYLSKMLNKI